jgi:hypothetical protein
MLSGLVSHYGMGMSDALWHLALVSAGLVVIGVVIGSIKDES